MENKMTPQSLAQMLHIAAVAGYSDFTIPENGGMIFADRVNPETGKKEVFVLNTGSSSIAYQKNCDNLVRACSNVIDFSPNPNVPQGKESDVLYSAIANMNENITEEMANNAKAANYWFKKGRATENQFFQNATKFGYSYSIQLGEALNTGLINRFASQTATNENPTNTDNVSENEGADNDFVMEFGPNN